MVIGQECLEQGVRFERDLDGTVSMIVPEEAFETLERVTDAVSAMIGKPVSFVRVAFVALAAYENGALGGAAGQRSDMLTEANVIAVIGQLLSDHSENLSALALADRQ